MEKQISALEFCNGIWRSVTDKKLLMKLFDIAVRQLR